MKSVPQNISAKQVPTEVVSPRFQRQRDRILDAATLSLNRNGVWGMTLQEVAGALGLRTSSVTYYFKKREHLAVAVFEGTLTRLSAMAHSAAQEPGPRQRVRRFVELYVAQYAQAQRGESRPLAILAEIRAMDESTRETLTARYQEIFRTIRAFFGPIDSPDRRDLLTARTHIMIESLFWAGIWLSHFPLADFPRVAERMLRLFDGGLLVPGVVWRGDPLAQEDNFAEPEQRDYLRIATRLINDHGYKGASVSRITGELRRAKTHLYRHSEGKDELFAACARTSSHRIAAIGRLATEQEPLASQRIGRIVGSVLALQFGEDFPLLRSSALQAMPEAVRAVAVERYERMAFSLMGLLVEAMEEGNVRIVDPFIAAQVLLSAIDSAYDLRRWRQEMPVDRAIAIYMEVLANGLFDRADAEGQAAGRLAR